MTVSGCTVDVVQSDFWQTNTGIITDPGGNVILIDPGVFPSELRALAQQIGEGKAVAAFSTHEDWDHVLWSTELGPDVPRLAHPETVRILTEGRDALLQSLSAAEEELGVTWDHDLVGRLKPTLIETVVPGAQVRITVISTPGHTEGHASLWLEDNRILFAGDMLSDVDPPILADDPRSADQFSTSLDKLESIVKHADIIVPGHGSICDRVEAALRLSRDRAYLDIVRQAVDTDTSRDRETIARRTSDALADPRIHWDEGWQAHTSNVETLMRTR